MMRSVIRRLAACAVTIFAITACHKDVESTDISPIAALLKSSDLAAVIDWTYSLDAETDHAICYTNAAEKYTRSDIKLTLRSKSKDKLPGLESASSVSVTVNSASDRNTGNTITSPEVTLNISTPGNGEIHASITGFKWDTDYLFTVNYDGESLSGGISTVDRKRDIIDITVPKYVIRLDDPGSGYDTAADKYTGPENDFSKELFDAFVSGKIINTDPESPDYADPAAFAAKEGILTVSTNAANSDQLVFGSDFAKATFPSSQKLKEVWEAGEPLTKYVTTYSGQMVRITLPFTVELPDYDFIHLSYYTFNTKMSAADFIQMRAFEENDGLVEWWTQVNPFYENAVGSSNPVSNRHALARYNVSNVALDELAFNVVDGNDNIMSEQAIAAAKLNVRFDYSDPGLNTKSLPTACRTGSYLNYGDLWPGKSTFYYRTNEKKFIHIQGHLSVKSAKGVEFELPTRFSRPKASVKYPDITLDYCSYSVVRWAPFKEPEIGTPEIGMTTPRYYRVPAIFGIENLMDSRPNGVSYYVIKNREWVVGDVTTPNTNSAVGNGYINGVSAKDAYGFRASAEISLDKLPKDLKSRISMQYSSDDINFVNSQNAAGTLMPYIVFNYPSETMIFGRIEVPVKLKLETPWTEAIECQYILYFLGLGS